MHMALVFSDFLPVLSAYHADFSFSKIYPRLLQVLVSKLKLCHLPSDVTELGDEFIGDVSGGAVLKMLSNKSRTHGL